VIECGGSAMARPPPVTCSPSGILYAAFLVVPTYPVNSLTTNCPSVMPERLAFMSAAALNSAATLTLTRGSSAPALPFAGRPRGLAVVVFVVFFKMILL
jgi:hypothetical protein